MAAKPVDREELNTGGVAADRLRSIVERIERLEEERKALGADIKDIYSEAKSAGFRREGAAAAYPHPQAGSRRGRGTGNASRCLPPRAGDVSMGTVRFRTV